MAAALLISERRNDPNQRSRVRRAAAIKSCIGLDGEDIEILVHLPTSTYLSTSTKSLFLAYAIKDSRAEPSFERGFPFVTMV